MVGVTTLDKQTGRATGGAPGTDGSLATKKKWRPYPISTYYTYYKLIPSGLN
jgi:hypothetical protein